MTDSNPQMRNKIIPIKLPSQVIFKDIIGQGSAMLRIFRMVVKVAECDTTIMLNGETGTGKGLIARAIHRASGRCDNPFIQINCGATPEGLLESEFFGYCRGAFTGATTDKAGKFEMAKGGTIFLDEIGDISLNIQAKLLRLLQEKSIERVGGKHPIQADVRIIAATNADLEKMVDTTDEWITTRTGIRERRIAGENETTSDMASEAARLAIQSAGLEPVDIGLIIVGTITPDMPFPNTACAF